MKTDEAALSVSISSLLSGVTINFYHILFTKDGDKDLFFTVILTHWCKTLKTTVWDNVTRAWIMNSLCVVLLPLGVPRPDGHSRSYSLCPQPTAHYRPHSGCVCVPGTGLQWPDLYLHLSADKGAMEPGGGAAGSLLYCYRPWLYLPLRGRILWQWRHRHLCPAVHLLPLGTLTHTVLYQSFSHNMSLFPGLP